MTTDNSPIQTEKRFSSSALVSIRNVLTEHADLDANTAEMLTRRIELMSGAGTPEVCSIGADGAQFIFWCIYAGFIPREYNGIIQRTWAVLTMGWFGVAAHYTLQRVPMDNQLAARRAA